MLLAPLHGGGDAVTGLVLLIEFQYVSHDELPLSTVRIHSVLVQKDPSVVAQPQHILIQPTHLDSSTNTTVSGPLSVWIISIALAAPR